MKLGDLLGKLVAAAAQLRIGLLRAVLRLVNLLLAKELRAGRLCIGTARHPVSTTSGRFFDFCS